MARGAEAKSRVQKQILEAFPGAFLYNDGKEIRKRTLCRELAVGASQREFRNIAPPRAFERTAQNAK